ncbi:MAG: DedA family protein [Patescibacteria group bacterium]|nr:DedA family protein [Patescibacteria group bacterium]MDE2015504.1 DedA family protein [Patescibacteria group bacterium]MDE2226880.1 DedA family protein [Patescibacteria group bacterium]
METLLGSFISYILIYRYAALFAFVFFAAVILPLPGNAMLLAIGALSFQGHFNIWLSLTVAVIANTLGDLFDYSITRKYGEDIIHWLGMGESRFFLRLKEELVVDAAVTVFITRFAGSLSPIASLLSGLVRVPFRTFIVYDLLGNLIEPAAALFIGYTAGNYWNNFSGYLSIFAGVIAVSIVIFVLVRIHNRITAKYRR